MLIYPIIVAKKKYFFVMYLYLFIIVNNFKNCLEKINKVTNIPKSGVMKILF